MPPGPRRRNRKGGCPGSRKTVEEKRKGITIRLREASVVSAGRNLRVRHMGDAPIKVIAKKLEVVGIPFPLGLSRKASSPERKSPAQIENNHEKTGFLLRGKKKCFPMEANRRRTEKSHVTNITCTERTWSAVVFKTNRKRQCSLNQSLGNAGEAKIGDIFSGHVCHESKTSREGEKLKTKARGRPLRGRSTLLSRGGGEEAHQPRCC